MSVCKLACGDRENIPGPGDREGRHYISACVLKGIRRQGEGIPGDREGRHYISACLVLMRCSGDPRGRQAELQTS